MIEFCFMERVVHNDDLYFVTFTTVEWIDIFTRLEYKQFLADQLNYCVENKGIQIFAYVIMTNHMHLLLRVKEHTAVGGFIRDYKTYTSKEIYKLIISNNRESRKEWLKEIILRNGMKNPRNLKIQIWQNGSHTLSIYSSKFLKQKRKYIHDNPVRAGIVDEDWKYLYSSANINSPVKVIG